MEPSKDMSNHQTSLEELDYYDVLGVSTSSTTADIVAAYRSKARDAAGLPTSDKLYILIKQVTPIYLTFGCSCCRYLITSPFFHKTCIIVREHC